MTARILKYVTLEPVRWRKILPELAQRYWALAVRRTHAAVLTYVKQQSNKNTD